MTLADVIAECPAEWEWLRSHYSEPWDDGADQVWMHTHVGPNHDWCVWTDGDADGWITTVGKWRDDDHAHLTCSAYYTPAMTYTSAVRAREGHLEACFAWDRQAREDQEEKN